MDTNNLPDKRDTEQYFGINAAARALGVSPSTLRNYENAGILNVDRNPDTGYKMVAIPEIERFKIEGQKDIERYLQNLRSKQNFSQNTGKEAFVPQDQYISSKVITAVLFVTLFALGTLTYAGYNPLGFSDNVKNIVSGVTEPLSQYSAGNHKDSTIDKFIQRFANAEKHDTKNREPRVLPFSTEEAKETPTQAQTPSFSTYGYQTPQDPSLTYLYYSLDGNRDIGQLKEHVFGGYYLPSLMFFPNEILLTTDTTHKGDVTHKEDARFNKSVWVQETITTENLIAKDDIQTDGKIFAKDTIKTDKDLIGDKLYTDTIVPRTTQTYIDIHAGIRNTKDQELTIWDTLTARNTATIHKELTLLDNLTGTNTIAWLKTLHTGGGYNQGGITLDSNGNLKAAGDFTIDGTTTFAGGTEVGDDFTVTGDVSIGGTLDVTGATTLQDTLGVTGATTLSSTLGVTGATTLSSTLGVTGATTLSDTLGVTGLATLSGGLNVTGDSTFTGNLLPGTDNTHDLGSPTARWRDMYLGPSSLRIYNQADATNFDAITLGYVSNVATLHSTSGGTGTVRPLQIKTGANDGLYMDTDGNVGIGTTSNLSDRLTVLSSMGITGTAGTAPDVRWQRGGAGNFQFIGAHTISTSTGDLTLNPAGLATIGSGAGDITLDPGANDLVVNLSGIGNFLIQEGGTTFAIFSTAGRLGIGTTEPNQKLEVDGRIRMSTWTADGDTAVYKANATGDIGVQSSDIRLKKNLEELSGALAVIDGLTAYKHNMIYEKDGAKKRIGVIAQDILPHFPEMTFNITDAGGNNFYGVHYDKLPVLLLSGMQEMNQTLNASINDSYLARGNLEGEVKDLRVSMDGKISYVQETYTADLMAQQDALLGLEGRVGTLDTRLTAVEAVLEEGKNENLIGEKMRELTERLETLEEKRLLTEPTEPPSEFMKDVKLFDNLNVLGKSVLSDASITGTLTMGLLTIDGLYEPRQGHIGAAINTLSGPLMLQSMGLGGVDILDGKLIIDTEGNLTVEGTVTAKEVEAEAFKVLGEETVGTVEIPPGDVAAEIETGPLSDNDLILVTPDIPVAVSARKTAPDSAEIRLAAPEEEEVTVTWWVVRRE